MGDTTNGRVMVKIEIAPSLLFLFFLFLYLHGSLHHHRAATDGRAGELR